MLKIIGLTAVFVACGAFGVNIYKYCVYCLKYTEGLIDGLKYLRREIEFTETYISGALEKASSYAGEAGVLFKKCAGNLKNSSEYIKSENISCEVKKICEYFFSQIGKNNLNNELKLIDITVEKLLFTKEKQREYCEHSGKLYAKSGFLVGLIVVILLT